MIRNNIRSRVGLHALCIGLLGSTLYTAPGYAQNVLPTGGQVVSGQAQISTDGSTMNVNQSSDRLIANWDSFSIGEKNSVIFVQPDANSIALNRVLGQDPSQILGNLIANGKIFLINPNGIVIGKDGRVQAGGFVGSTLHLSDADFLAGRYQFAGSGGAISNLGDLKGGIVALIAPMVTNGGAIHGDTALAAGTAVLLDFDGDGLIGVVVSASSLATLVDNQGLIKADGGVAILTAKGANDALRGVVNNSGVIEATALESRDGRILLLGDMEYGTVNAGGTLVADFVETSASRVNIADDMAVKTDGGQWLIDPNDFTIAESGGNISGTTLSNNLQNGNVTITTATQGTAGGNGDIFVNDGVSWAANTLTLNADRNITINSELFGSGTAGLALEYAQTDASGDYYVNAPVNLASTGSFSTKHGSDAAIDYTIITSLGEAGSTTGTDLQGINGNLSGNYVLGSNINASDTVHWNSGAGFDPIGEHIVTSETSGYLDSFNGNFDGLRHAIYNLVINRHSTDYVGLFSSSTNTGKIIRNVSLIGGSITGQDNVGGLSGFIWNSDVRNVSSSVEVKGRDFVGGLFGSVSSSKIKNSFASGEVISTGGVVGGLVGANNPSTSGNSIITNSYATGNVSATGSTLGGQGSDVGGLIGRAWQITVSNSFSTGNVTGNRQVGGLIGWSDVSTVNNTYSTGSVNGVGTTAGLVGYSTGSSTLSNSFWDREVSGQSAACATVVGGSSCSATGITTAQMKDPATFIAAGWDFDTIWAVDPDINNGYPYLRATVADTVTPPPPPPPPPPAVLAINDFGTSFTTSSAPYQPTIALTGTGFSSVTEVQLTWTDPNGQTGTVVWNAANNFGGGKFVVGADGTSATITPVLVAAGDPSGASQWSVTFVAGDQSLTRDFTVTYTAVVEPPPPPPPPVALTVNDFGSSFTTSSAPYNPTIDVTGTGLDTVTEVRLTWTDPNGQTGTVIWNAANEFGDKRFVPSADGKGATIAPVLVAAGDPAGSYQWTVTFVAGDKSSVHNFAVTYTAVVEPPPPPPPPPTPEPLALNGGIADSYATSQAPYVQPLTLTGQGLDGVTAVTLSWIDPTGETGGVTWRVSDNFDGERFVPSTDGTSAKLSPKLIATGDPAGLYQWTITLTNGDQTETRSFLVVYNTAQLDEPVINRPGEGIADSSNSLQESLFEPNPYQSTTHFLQWYTQREREFIQQYRAACSACANFDQFEITDEVILHWGRNELEKSPDFLTILELEEAAKKQGWILTVASESQEVFHQNTAVDVIKYIANSGYEWVFDASTGLIIKNDADKGTFNYGPIAVSQEHIEKDILPWIKWGSGPNDLTTYEQRKNLFMQGWWPQWMKDAVRVVLP